jgi:hypothetical protein
MGSVGAVLWGRNAWLRSVFFDENGLALRQCHDGKALAWHICEISETDDGSGDNGVDDFG